MEQQEKVENTVIGLHRPFNMPLKSLVWVCRFSKNYKKREGHDYYLDFFLWMLKAIDEHLDSFEEQNAEGIIRPQNAQNILQLDLLASTARLDEYKDTAYNLNR